MSSPAQEERLLELAIKRGVLTEGDLLEAAAAVLGAGTVAAVWEGRYGPRIERLIGSGRMEPRMVDILLDELAAQERTLDGTVPSRTKEGPAEPGAPPAAGLPARIGEAPPQVSSWDRYSLEARLGQGGMGVVYRAMDRRLGRTVALKFMRKADPQTTQRFLREARAQARIQHPAVCQIFDAGEYAGFPYIAMECLPGKPLHIAQNEMSIEQKICVAREITAALQAAHSLGIIHRDIKPHNILAHLQPDGQWQAKVLDFGLALDVGMIDSLTESGAVLGTPAYMAPEQVTGGAAVDRRTDVYGIGAVLYQLLTQEPPFSGRTPGAVLHQVLHNDPRPPGERAPSVPRTLELITLKCLRKEPAHRYQSAQELADELWRYLSGEPIAAARWQWLYRLRRGARRHRLLVATSLVATLGLGSAGAVSVRARQHADRRARLAHELGREVELSELFLRSAYLLPLHSIGPEQAEIHARIERITSQLKSLDRTDVPLAHQALGQAYLALRSYSLAVQQLRLALAGGSNDRSVHYGLGLALGALYQIGMRDVERQGDPGWRVEREKELRAQFLEPAQAHFLRAQQSGVASMESPEYAEAVIAFFALDDTRTIERASAALRKQPWRFEIKRLLGDVYYRRATRGMERQAYADARADLRSSIEHYQEAESIAHSDPELHLAAADAWMAQVTLDMLQGVPPHGSREQVLAACARLARSDPEDHRRHFIEYTVHFSMAYYLMEHGSDPAPALQLALDASESCIRTRPQEPFCHDAASTVWALRAERDLAQARDPEEPLRRAQSHHERAIELNPNSARLWQGRGAIQSLLCKRQLLRGQDERPYFDGALRAFRKARELRPDVFFSNELLFGLLASYAETLVARGRSPQELLVEAQDWVRIARTHGGLTFPARESLAQLYLSTAEYERAHGGDPAPLLSAAQAEITEALKINPRAPRSVRLLASLSWLNAQRAHEPDKRHGISTASR